MRREVCTLANLTYSVHTSTDKCLHFAYIVHIHITSLFSYLDISLATSITHTNVPHNLPRIQVCCTHGYS